MGDDWTMGCPASAMVAVHTGLPNAIDGRSAPSVGPAPTGATAPSAAASTAPSAAATTRLFVPRRPTDGVQWPPRDGQVFIGAPFGVSKPIFQCAEQSSPTGRFTRRPIASHTVTAPERPPEPGEPVTGSRRRGFLPSLAEAFRRHRPQGSARWNFSDAFGRLEALFGAGRTAPRATGRRPQRPWRESPADGRTTDELRPPVVRPHRGRPPAALDRRARRRGRPRCRRGGARRGAGLGGRRLRRHHRGLPLPGGAGGGPRGLGRGPAGPRRRDGMAGAAPGPGRLGRTGVPVGGRQPGRGRGRPRRVRRRLADRRPWPRWGWRCGEPSRGGGGLGRRRAWRRRPRGAGRGAARLGRARFARRARPLGRGRPVGPRRPGGPPGDGDRPPGRGRRAGGGLRLARPRRPRGGTPSPGTSCPVGRCTQRPGRCCWAGPASRRWGPWTGPAGRRPTP